MADFFLDLVGGNDANNGTTFALRKKTLESFTSGISAGDRIKIMKTDDGASLGQNATFTNKSVTVTLTSAVTANICTCENNWTASADITCATTTTRKEGSYAVSITPASGFTTGLMAYYATGTLDLSAYEKISFWIYQPSGVFDLAANTLRIDLCSDAAGTTPVNSFTIDKQLSSNTGWFCFTFDNGGALGSAIESVALVALLDPGYSAVYLDNIIACNDLSLNSLISDDSSIFYPLKSVNGTTLVIGDSSASTGTARGYSGTTGSRTIYYLNPLQYLRATASNRALQYSAGHGSSGNQITISGGWDVTDMSTQTGETWVDGQNVISGVYAMTDNANQQYLKWEKIGAVRYGRGYSPTVATGHTLSYCSFVGCTTGAYMSSNSEAVGINSDHCKAIANGTNAFIMYCPGTHTDLTVLSNTDAAGGVQLGTAGFSLSTATIKNNSTNGIGMTTGTLEYAHSLTIADNGTNGIYMGGGGRIRNLQNATISGNGGRGAWIQTADANFSNCAFSSNTTSDILAYSSMSKVRLRDCTLSSGTTVEIANIGYDCEVRSSRHGATAGDHRQWLYGGTIATDTGTKPAAVDRSWKLNPTSTTKCSVTNPLRLKLATLACKANQAVTATFACRRSNTGLTMNLKVYGQYPGITSDVATVIDPAADTWEDNSVTFTPTGDCVVEIWGEAYGGTTYSGYFAGPVVIS